jgi:beta-phosphoglucomutase
MYQATVVSKPRMAGALAALEALGVPDALAEVDAYAARKQAKLKALIADGHVAAPLTVRFPNTGGVSRRSYVVSDPLA